MGNDVHSNSVLDASLTYRNLSDVTHTKSLGSNTKFPCSSHLDAKMKGQRTPVCRYKYQLKAFANNGVMKHSQIFVRMLVNIV